MSSSQLFPIVASFGFVYLSDWPTLKNLKKILPPAIFATFLFRYRIFANNNDSKSFLKIILNMISDLIEEKKFQLLLGDVLGVAAITGILTSLKTIYKLKVFGNQSDIMFYIYNTIKNLPIIAMELQKERKKLRQGLEKDIKSKARTIGQSIDTSSLPKQGLSHNLILKALTNASTAENSSWEDGKVSGAVYHGGKDHLSLLNKAFSMYSLANPLHADVFPSLIKFESEIISMTSELVGGNSKTNPGIQGCTTSGGTESIVLAIKAHRDYFRDEKGIHEPNMICCTTAHAAVDKACDLLNIELIKLLPNEVEDENGDGGYTLSVADVDANITANTILIYSSAPSFAQGSADPIQALSELACKRDVGLHVDCCLGGFVLPFMKELGYDVPPFDFTLPGVSSMSLDTHKYGYALKGSSVVLYGGDNSLIGAGVRRCQYFCYPGWTGGLYTTPTLAGSRSGGLVAQCWASMVAMGRDGYKDVIKGIIQTTRNIVDGISKIPELEIIGGAKYMIVCFKAKQNNSSDIKNNSSMNIYNVHDYMTKKGWSLNSLQHPACVHLCVTRCHTGIEEDFIHDLQEAVKHACEMAARGEASGSAAIYGMTGSLPEGPVNELLKEYNDCLLDVRPE